MKILFVADLHYALKQFDWLTAKVGGFDLAIIGGDLLDLSSALELDVQIVVVEKYLNRLRERTPLLVCSGNHDCNTRTGDGECTCRWLQDCRADRLFVDGDSLELGDTLITICPWWDGPISQAKLEEQLGQAAARRKSKWVWINHAPPNNSPVSWTGKKYAGDESLIKWIERYEPDLVLSGHIHNAPFVSKGSWIDRIGKTWVFNPGRQIGPNPAYLIFDLEKMTVEWDSLEGQGSQQLDVPAGAFKGGAAAGA